jgi:CBS domain-containing protein
MAILMLFEMTGDYQVILPLMISCVIAGLLTSRLKKDSIYTQKLSRRGVSLTRGFEATVMETTRVGDVMRAAAPTVAEDAPFAEVLRRLFDAQSSQIYVAGADGRLAGVIALHDVKAILNESGLEQVLVAADVMETDVPRVTPASTLAECVARFGTSLLEELPLVAGGAGDEADRLVGVVTRRDIFLLYEHEVLRRGTLGLKFVHRDPQAPRSDYVEMAPDHEVGVVRVTRALAGRTLRDLDVRRRFAVNVVAIRPAGARAGAGGGAEADSDVPDPARPLRRGDTLVVTGSRDAIARFEREQGGGADA